MAGRHALVETAPAVDDIHPVHPRKQALAVAQAVGSQIALVVLIVIHIPVVGREGAVCPQVGPQTLDLRKTRGLAAHIAALRPLQNTVQAELHDIPFQADSLLVGNKITVDHLVPDNNVGPAAAQISVGLDLPFYFIQVAVGAPGIDKDQMPVGTRFLKRVPGALRDLPRALGQKRPVYVKK